MLQMYFGWVGVVLGHFLFLMKRHAARVLYNVRKRSGKKKIELSNHSIKQTCVLYFSCSRVYMNSQKLASESIKMQKMMLSRG